MRFRLPALAVAISMVPATSAAQAPWPAELVAADRAASRRSGSEGIARALASVLAEDALILYPGMPLLQNAALHVLQSLPATGSRVQWDAVFVELSADGRLAAMYGTTLTRGHPDSASRQGRYLSAWQRNTAGDWKLHALALIGSAPADSMMIGRIVARRSMPVARENPFAAADLDFAQHAQRGVADAFAGFAAPDAVLIGASEPFARGPNGIRDALIRNGIASLAWNWRPVYALGDGTIGVTLGEAEIGTFYSQYMSLWRRNPDGTIKYIADGGAERPAPK